MPEFDTPEPIAVTVDAVCANITMVAGDRIDTVVDVQPTNQADESDVRAAEATRVEYANGRLVVKGPRRRGLFNNKSESFDVRIELPTGSTVDADVTVGGLTAEGRIGQCRFKTQTGGISVDQTGALRLNTTMGRVSVGRAEGRVEITTGTGDVLIDELHGPAVVKNLNGDTRVGELTGELQVSSANGDVFVERAGGTVVAKSAHGSIRLAEVVRGSVDLDVAAGSLDVGIREGTAAWLDVNSISGRVRNSMTATDQPDTGDTVQVRARTVAGDITIRRA